MTIQTVSLGAAPGGAGGDTFRSTGAKMNENFTNNSHAASRLVGTATGNVMEVGAFGFGGSMIRMSMPPDSQFLGSGFYYFDVGGAGSTWQEVETNVFAMRAAFANSPLGFEIGCAPYSNTFYLRGNKGVGVGWRTPVLIRHSGNTTIDSNGFIKNASPVIKLFSDKIESNDEAQQQNPVFEKVDVGHYLVKNTDGFAQEGWWIEVPTDSNGNRICAVEYQTLENGDLEIKTFKKKLSDEGDIVANLDAPIDIPSNANGEPRWIDIRLHSVPKPTNPRVPRTEKQPRMIQQLKYAPQLVYFMALSDMVDDDGKVVVVDGETQQVKKPQIQTDANGTPILKDQQVVNEKGEPVFEWVQAVDAEGNLIFDDVPVLDADGNQIYDEVAYEPQQ